MVIPAAELRGIIGIKTTLVQDLLYLSKKFHFDAKLQFFQSQPGRVLALIGGMILWLLPLPDELPLAILGISKTTNKLFIFLSLAINFCTIYLIGVVANGKL